MNILKVAFIFAGGYRTFREPAIHESIRFNLIRAFCPAPDCSADVFIRLSTSDNSHVGQGMNAKGKSIPTTDSLRNHALGVSARFGSDPSFRLFFELVDIGSPADVAAMDGMTNHNPKQHIYRTFDPRRYSMYFNRHMAYEMAMKAERLSGINYTWVVHARLDMGWGAPIAPFNRWSRQVWVPDSWPYDVPDTFALLPRKYSDHFFSLDAMFQKGVFCLGGPNFDLRTISTPSLQQLGYNSSQISLIQAEECQAQNIQPNHIYYYDRQNISYCSAGVSEIILKRKLLRVGIHAHSKFEEHRIRFSTFFMFLSRLPFQLNCDYISASFFMNWLRDQRANDAVESGCYTMQWYLNLLRNIYPTSGGYGPNCNLSSYTSVSPAVKEPLSMCLLDRSVSDLNFLPYRLRRKEHSCLTIHKQDVSNGPAVLLLSLSECVETYKLRQINRHYHVAQLFNFFPRSGIPHKITLYSGPHGGLKCLSVCRRTHITQNVSIIEGAESPMLVELAVCDKNAGNKDQLFVVDTLDRSLAPWLQKRHHGDAASNSSKATPSVQDITVVSLRWAGDPTENLCVSVRRHMSSRHDRGSPPSVTADSSYLSQSVSAVASLVPCRRRQRVGASAIGTSPLPDIDDSAEGTSRVNPLTTFVLEKTVNRAATT